MSAFSSRAASLNPAAWWRHGEASGTTMLDSSGNGRAGSYIGGPTLGAVGLIAGDTDTAASFNGSSQRASISYAPWMAPARISLVQRIKPTSLSGTRTTIARDTTSGLDRSWQLRLNAGKVEFVWWITSAATMSGPYYATGSTVLTAGTEHTIGARFDGQTATVFVDGVADGSFSHVGIYDLWPATNTSIYIGSVSNSSTQAYSGVIDETLFFGSVLLDSDFLALHADATGAAPAPAALAANLSATASLTVAAPKVTTHLAAALSAESNLTADLVNPAAPLPLAASLSAVGNLAAALTLVPGVVVVETSTQYANDGYGYDGMAAVYFEDGIAPTPAHIRRSTVLQVHQSMSAPNLVNGVPR